MIVSPNAEDSVAALMAVEAPVEVVEAGSPVWMGRACAPPAPRELNSFRMEAHADCAVCRPFLPPVATIAPGVPGV